MAHPSQERMVRNSSVQWSHGAGMLAVILVVAGQLGRAGAEDFREVYRTPFGLARAVSADTSDGSCWAVTGASVMHLGVDGTMLSQTNGFRQARSIACNPTDASSWVADTEHHEVVQGYDATTYAPDLIVDRAQMAVYVARAVAGGDSLVPDGPPTATFNDVPTGYWAYKYVEYCKANGIVQGHDAVTYAPEVDVTRDQMAVYVQRAFQLPM